MGIEIPGYLQWVSYLAGSEWPQGDETAMFRIGDDWRSSASDLSALIPDLNRVRSGTLSVLMGETADAADAQFQMLFDGDYSVDKLAEAMTAIGDLADGAGTEIEYTKLQILTSLAIAAAEIAWALAAAPETFGGSLALIPPAEALTVMTVRQLISMLLRQILRKLTEAMSRTLVRRILREVGEEVAIGLAQELAIQKFQESEGHRNGIDWKQVGIITAASGIGAAAATPTAHGLSHALGNATTPLTGAVKGTVSGYGAGVVGNVAGTLATGGDLDATSIFGGAASSAATGGVRGARRGGSDGGPHGDPADPSHPDAADPRPVDTDGADSAAPKDRPAGTSEDLAAGNGHHPPADAAAPPSSNADTATHADTQNGHAGYASDGGTHTAPHATAGIQDTVGPDTAAAHHDSAGPDSAVSHHDTTHHDTTHHDPAGPDSAQPQHTPATTDPTSDSTPTRPAGAEAPPTDGQPHTSGDPRAADAPSLERDHPGTPQTSSGQTAAAIASPTAPQALTSPTAGPGTPGSQTVPTAPAAGPSTHQTAGPVTSTTPTARPTLSEPSATTSTTPAGSPTARTAASAPETHHDPAARPDGHQDRATSDPAIPPMAVAAGPAVGHVGPTRGADAGPPTSRPRSGAERIGAPPPERPGGPPHRDGAPDDRGRAGHGDDAGTPGHHADAADTAAHIADMERHRTDPTDGDAARAHREAQAVRDRWNDLSTAERDAVLAHETQQGHRTRMGDLDGLPAEVRDRLNRHNLVEDMARTHPQSGAEILHYARQMDLHLADPEHNARPAPIRDAEPPSRRDRLAAAINGPNNPRTRGAEAVFRTIYGAPDGSPPRQLYTYDPRAFNGSGRAVVVVGNLDTAGAVAVHVPGITTTMRSIGVNVDNAENLHIRARQERPTLPNAVVAWIGYDAPSGPRIGQQTATQALARQGGDRLAHDVAGIAGARTDTPAIHLMGHSYGSTTTAHAGHAGRLAPYVDTVTLLGSPGAGPMHHASEFGIGDRVYVVSNSRDPVTYAGSRTPGGANRVLTGVNAVGQGFDPAQREFGAQRLAAQYEAPEHNAIRTLNPHTNYFSTENVVDGTPALLRDAPSSRVTESLDNTSHILTGSTGELRLETAHRDPDSFVADPASVRRAQPGAYPGNDCVPRTIDGLHHRHPEIGVQRVPGDHGGLGVTRADYERALGTRLRDATDEDILAATRRGETVVVVDTYHADGLPAEHPGSHTYAVEPNPRNPDRPYVYEGNERIPREWPTSGRDLVSRTQIATFHPDGTPTHPWSGDPAETRAGHDDRIAGDQRGGDDLPPHTAEAHYPPDHVSHVLGLPGYHPGSLSDVEARTVYLNGEQRMNALYDSLVADRVDAETLGRRMFEARNELRSWARELMSDRTAAAELTRQNPNHSWDSIVEKYRSRGYDGDALYRTIAEKSMTSRPSVNQHLGLDPTRPPDLPPVREPPEPLIGAPAHEPSAAQIEALKNLGEHIAPADLQALVDKHGLDAVTWLADTLHGPEARALSDALTADAMKAVRDIPAAEVLDAMNKIGDGAVNDLAVAVHGKGIRDLADFNMFVFDPAKQELLDNGAGQTVRNLGPIDGAELTDIENGLIQGGFVHTASHHGQDIWTHDDGSVVRIKTGPQALTGARPDPHFVREISKTPHAFAPKDIFTKVTQHGTVIPAGTKFAVNSLTNWFKNTTGRLPSQAELDRLMGVWGDAGHGDVTIP